MNVSLRIHNDTYAPGIATYGIPGKPGEQGLPGASMFFTDFNITTSAGLRNFALKITSRMLPLSNKEIVLDRKYINNDTFVKTDGTIHLLKDINQLSIDYDNGSTTMTYNKYFTQIGKFTPGNIFTSNNAASNGAEIKTKKLSISDNGIETGSALLNITKSDTNQQINFIDLKALYGNAADMNFNIIYDDTLKGFVLKSKYPIILDSNVYVTGTAQPSQINQYSPVFTSDKSITKFVGLCRKVSYSLDASIYTYSPDDSSALYYGSVYNITLNDTGSVLERINDYYTTTDKLLIHFLNKDFQDFQFYRKDEKTYYFKQDYNIVKLNDIITKIAYTDLQNIQVSLIDNTEVYLKKDDYSLSGYGFIKTTN